MQIVLRIYFAVIRVCVCLVILQQIGFILKLLQFVLTCHSVVK